MIYECWEQGVINLNIFLNIHYMYLLYFYIFVFKVHSVECSKLYFVYIFVFIQC